MSILYIKFPQDFDKRYKQYKQMLLDVLKKRGAETQKEKPETFWEFAEKATKLMKGQPIVKNNDELDATAAIKQLPEQQSEKSLFVVPKGTRWEEITIKFKNDFDVDVIIKGKTYPSDYDKMGFADKRIKKADEKAKYNDSWNFLILLSTAEGTFPLNKLTGSEKEQRIKQKQSLSKALVKCFPTIEDKDPFYEYSDLEKVYRIKLTLIPIKTFRKDFRDKDIKFEADYDTQIKQSFDDMTKI